jgi:hypothetical protein
MPDQRHSNSIQLRGQRACQQIPTLNPGSSAQSNARSLNMSKSARCDSGSRGSGLNGEAHCRSRKEPQAGAAKALAGPRFLSVTCQKSINPSSKVSSSTKSSSSVNCDSGGGTRHMSYQHTHKPITYKTVELLFSSCLRRRYLQPVSRFFRGKLTPASKPRESTPSAPRASHENIASFDIALTATGVLGHRMLPSLLKFTWHELLDARAWMTEVCNTNALCPADLACADCARHMNERRLLRRQSSQG